MPQLSAGEYLGVCEGTWNSLSELRRKAKKLQFIRQSTKQTDNTDKEPWICAESLVSLDTA